MQCTVLSFIRVAEIAVMIDVDVYFRTRQITKFYDFPTKSYIGILFCIHNIFRDNFQPKFCLVLPTESGQCINVLSQLADNPQALPFCIIDRLILATAIPCTPIGRLRAQYSVSQMRLSTSGNRKRLNTEQLRQFIGAIVVGYHTEIAVTIGGDCHILVFRRPSHHPYNSIPFSFATVLMSLSPRPDRLTRITWSLPIFGALATAHARA